MEERHGARAAITTYPLFENAIRGAPGRSIGQHQAELNRVPHPPFTALASGAARIETYTATHDKTGLRRHRHRPARGWRAGRRAGHYLCAGTTAQRPVEDSLTALHGRSPYHKVRKLQLSAFAMTTATLSSKGQITVPAAVRTALGVETGDRVEFVEIAPGRYEFIAATRPVTALKGMFGTPHRPVSIDEMNAAIARRGAAARDTADDATP